VELDLEPVPMECMRCHRTEPMRFYGVCATCRAELHERFARDARAIEVEEYVPKMNVTPNAVAVKE
jgi:hypothetical protein